ncbi:MAG: NUDIX hydrolase [bacterium]
MTNNFPDIAVDVVLFSYFEKSLNVLLIKRNIEPFKNKYALPGVLLKENETADQAAIRTLNNEANIDIDYLEQLYTFSSINRDPRKRIISITYFGLIDQTKHDVFSDENADDIRWWNVSHFHQIFGEGNMAFDHYDIINYAIKRLRTKIQYEPIGIDLLPDYFTIGEMYTMYTTILDKTFDRRNFSRKVLSYGLIKKTNFKSSGRVGRKGQLYEFDDEKYNTLKKSGLYFEI